MTEIPAVYGRAALRDPSSFSRVFEVTGCRTQAELADFLGVRQSSISDAKKRSSIPSAWLLTLLYKKWINPTWILTGQGARWLQPLEPTAPMLEKSVPVVVRRPPSYCTTDELIEEIARRTVRGMALITDA